MLLYNGFLVYIKDDLPHWLESVTSHCYTRSNWLGPVTSSCHTTTQLIRANHFQQAIIRQISLVFQFYFIYMWFLLLHITFKKTYPMPSLTWHHISFFSPGTTVVFLFFSYFLLTMERHISILLRLPTCYLFCFSNFCYFANFCVQPSRNVSRLSPYFSPFFFGYAGTFKAIARIIDVLSVCPRGEGSDYARNKADCLSTCKFLLSFFSWFLFLCSHSTCSFFFHHALYDCHF